MVFNGKKRGDVEADNAAAGNDDVHYFVPGELPKRKRAASELKKPAKRLRRRFTLMMRSPGRDWGRIMDPICFITLSKMRGVLLPAGRHFRLNQPFCQPVFHGALLKKQLETDDINLNLIDLWRTREVLRDAQAGTLPAPGYTAGRPGSMIDIPIAEWCG